MSLPPAVEALTNTLLSLPGVAQVEPDCTPLAELNEEHLSLVSYGDLPHAALLRTKGGVPAEALGQFFIVLRREEASWYTLEFLSWQVRDCSRGGQRIQFRSRGLPPFIDGRIQLGTTLAFILEFFADGMDMDDNRLLDSIAAFAKSLQESLEEYGLNWDEGAVRKADVA